MFVSENPTTYNSCSRFRDFYPSLEIFKRKQEVIIQSYCSNSRLSLLSRDIIKYVLTPFIIEGRGLLGGRVHAQNCSAMVEYARTLGFKGWDDVLAKHYLVKVRLAWVNFVTSTLWSANFPHLSKRSYHFDSLLALAGPHIHVIKPENYVFTPQLLFIFTSLGRNINQPWQGPNHHSETLLHISCLYRTATVKPLIDLGADPNCFDQFGDTPLINLCFNEKVENFEHFALLAHLCKKEIILHKSENSKSAKDILVERNLIKLAEILVNEDP